MEASEVANQLEEVKFRYEQVMDEMETVKKELSEVRAKEVVATRRSKEMTALRDSLQTNISDMQA
jgi:hypothetical protein